MAQQWRQQVREGLEALASSAKNEQQGGHSRVGQHATKPPPTVDVYWVQFLAALSGLVPLLGMQGHASTWVRAQPPTSKLLQARHVTEP